jgi:GNAT superfamily N-acetyltransferase
VVEFLAATERDLDRLLGWVADLYAHEGIPFDANVARRAFAMLLAQPSLGRVWLLAVESEPVGYLAITFGYSIEYGGRDALLDELFVSEPHRGRGLGRRALEFAAAECRKLGVCALHLEVERANAQAQRLYHAAGFVDHERYLLSRRL